MFLSAIGSYLISNHEVIFLGVTAVTFFFGAVGMTTFMFEGVTP